MNTTELLCEFFFYNYVILTNFSFCWKSQGAQSVLPAFVSAVQESVKSEMPRHLSGPLAIAVPKVTLQNHIYAQTNAILLIAELCSSL